MSPRQLMEAVARKHGVTEAQLKGPSRHKTIVKARHEAMLWLRISCDMSYPEIAKALGRTDHTSAIHGAEKAFERMPARGAA